MLPAAVGWDWWSRSSGDLDLDLEAALGPALRSSLSLPILSLRA